MATKNSKIIRELKNSAIKCCYCDRRFDNNDMLEKTVDHFIPLSKEGSNEDDNKVICCHQCNHMKGDYLPHEFIYVIAQHIRHNKPLQSRVTYPVELLKVIYKNLKAGIPLLLATPKPGTPLPLTVDVNRWLKGEVAAAKPKRQKRTPKVEKGEIVNIPKVEPLPLDPISIGMKNKRLKRIAEEDAEQGYVFSVSHKHENFHYAE